MAGGHHATHQLDRRDREVEVETAAQRLDDLRLVPVAGWLEGAHDTTPLRVVGAGGRLSASLR